MLRRIHVQNFKSIADLAMEPGLVNVLIGENGCGKSNFLEALAFTSAAEADRLDNEFLTSRGIRVTAPEFMRSAFKNQSNETITLDATHHDGHRTKFKISNRKDSHYPRWLIEAEHRLTNNKDIKAALSREPTTESMNAVTPEDVDSFLSALKKLREKHQAADTNTDLNLESEEVRERTKRILATIFDTAEEETRVPRFTEFLVYSPENSALRTFAQEGQVLPLGIKGEGLFKLIRFLSTDQERWTELKFNLKMLDWFRDLKIAPEQAPFEQTLQIHDRFLAKDLEYFDQRSANEGFLFLLFYISLMISPDTPSIFSIDNIDASLNPKTAAALTSRLVKLAKKYNKQIFLTTHSPAVLDGLDLTEPEHRLFVFHRNRKGETRCRRIEAPQPVAGETPVKLSEAFLRGLIGGLPQNF